MSYARIAAGIQVFVLCAATTMADEKPTGFQQILPRGGIEAIDAPVYVSAQQARIPDTAWVLGLEIDGQAFAYSLNLLNAHEVVNDEAGGRAFAAVW